MDIVIRGLRYRNARIFFSCEHSIYLEGIFSTFCSYSNYCKVFNNCDVLVIQVLRQLLILFFLLEVVTFFSFCILSHCGFYPVQFKYYVV